jgi:hypothetical protein
VVEGGVRICMCWRVGFRRIGGVRKGSALSFLKDIAGMSIWKDGGRREFVFVVSKIRKMSWWVISYLI